MSKNEWKRNESRRPTTTGSNSEKLSTINSRRKKDGTDDDEREDKIFVEKVNPPYKDVYVVRLVWGDRAFYMTKDDAIRLAAKIVEAAV